MARVRGATDEINSYLRPAARTPEAGVGANIIRHNAAENAQVISRIHEAFRETRDYLGKFSQMAQREFIYKMETGAEMPTRELQAAADLLNRSMELHRNELIRKGAFKHPEALLENYFPHIWKNPERAREFYQSIIGKYPIEGSKAMLKDRTLWSTEEGLTKGLEPVSYNPADLVELKMAEINKFLTAQNIMDELAANGLLREWKPGQERRPAGYGRIDDPIARIRGGKELKEYIAPEGVARVINNYLSPGLRDKSGIFRAGMDIANSVNQFQLGMSLFHGLFTSVDAATSTFAIGLKKAAAGQIGAGAKDMLKGLTLVEPAIENVRFGNKLYQEYIKPGSYPEVAQLVEVMKAGGGRAQLHPFYQTDYVRRVQDLWRQGNVVGAAMRAPQAAVEKMAKPLMEWFVPRQKLGVFGKMAEFELSRLTPEQLQDTNLVRQIFGKCWDSVDNRMGQLVYDNLFWPKTLKDLSMISMRSVGWNLGTIREIGGGAKDSVKFAKQVLTGKAKQAEFTHRMAYITALPMVVGTLGAITQYALTGQGPESYTDYFFPKTGGTDEYGRPERISMPSYIKDIAHAGDLAGEKGPVRGAADFMAGKANPAITMVKEMLENKDFWGVQVYGEEDPLYQQGLQLLGHVAKTFTPFGLRNVYQEAQRGNGTAQDFMKAFSGVIPGWNYQPDIAAFDPNNEGSEAQKLMKGFGSFVGITPAPAYVKQSPMERRLSTYAKEKLPEGGRTQEEYDRADFLRRAERKLRLGGDIAEDMRNAVASGKIGLKQVEGMAQDMGTTHTEAQMRKLTLDQAIRAMELASPDEVALNLKPFVNKVESHLQDLATMPVERRDQTTARVRAVFEKLSERIRTPAPPL